MNKLEELSIKLAKFPYTEHDVKLMLEGLVSDSIAESEAAKWKPYPENVPETQGEYWIQMNNGNNEVCEFDGFSSGWQGRFNTEVIAFRELPAAYTEKGVETDGT
jgi:hypothetical protein